MFENPIIESNIIEVGQVVPEICHFLYFPRVMAAILDFGRYMCLKKCNPRFLFSSYTNKVKSITISLWASDSYGTVKSIHGGLHYHRQGRLTGEATGHIHFKTSTQRL